MEDITLLRVKNNYSDEDEFEIFETNEEFQTFMNRHYKSDWEYQVYNCILREDNNTPINERCW